VKGKKTRGRCQGKFWGVVERMEFQAKGLLKNNWDKIVPRFWSDLDVTIEKKPRHSTAMLRLFRLRRVQRWPKGGMGFCPSYFLTGLKGSRKNNFLCLGVDPSYLAALLVLSIQGSMCSPRALPDRRLNAQT